MMEAKVRYCIRVRGRVQGVSYRKYTHQEAVRLCLSGFVKNEPDGSVYLEAEGAPAHLEVLLEWCRRGPPAAHVSAVEVQQAEPSGYTGFEIRY